MAQRTLPGLGLTGFWDLGFEPWKDENDVNLRLLSALVQPRALDLVAAEPGSPSDGDIYLLDETHATQANAVAIRDAGAWVYVAPQTGWVVYDVTLGGHREFNGTVWAAFAPGSGGTAATLDFDTDGTLAANSDAVVATQKATKTYVDASVAAAVAAAGGTWKLPVRAASTAAVTLASDLENGDTLDGVVLATGDRVLVKDQAAPAENGIYVVAASGAPARATDADAGAELVNAAVLVSEGTANADKLFVCTTNAPITVGTTGLTFVNPFGGLGGGDLLAANNLSDVANAATARSNLSAAAKSQTTEGIAGFIASPSDKDYRIVVKTPHAGTITETTTRSASGTCTATFKVNTTALGGTANSVSSSEQSQAHASSNTFSAGDDIVLTVSSNSSCTDMSFSVKYTRALE